MPGNQSGLQSFIQQMAGTQSGVQSAVPVQANNGNPGTAYNIAPLPAWGTYVPTTTPGQPPSTTFDLVQAPYTPSSPGYVSPFTADPTVAMVLSQMPQAQGNPLINQMLQRITRPRPSGPAPGVPGTTPPGTTPPGTTPPGSGPAPNRPGLPGVPMPRPVGPISGPIHNNIHNWRDNYNNAMPRTNLRDAGLGREGALDWFYQQTDHIIPPGSFNFTTGPLAAGSEDGQGFLSGLLDNVMQFIGNIPEEIAEGVRDFAQDITFQNGAGEGITRIIGLIDPVLGTAVGALIRQFSDNSDGGEMSAEQLAQLQSSIQQTLNQASSSMAQNAQQEAMQRITEAVERYQVPLDGSFDAEAYYNAQGQWGGREWQNLMSRVGLINFMNSFGQGVGSNPISHHMNQDLIDNAQSARAQRALEIIRQLERSRRRMK